MLICVWNAGGKLQKRCNSIQSVKVAWLLSLKSPCWEKCFSSSELFGSWQRLKAWFAIKIIWCIKSGLKTVCIDNTRKALRGLHLLYVMKWIMGRKHEPCTKLQSASEMVICLSNVKIILCKLLFKSKDGIQENTVVDPISTLFRVCASVWNKAFLQSHSLSHLCETYSCIFNWYTVKHLLWSEKHSVSMCVFSQLLLVTL